LGFAKRDAMIALALGSLVLACIAWCSNKHTQPIGDTGTLDN